MRPLEILTPFVLFIYLVWPFTGKKRPNAVGILPAFALVIIATHANVEGMRWQMIPLYVFSAMTLLLSIPAFFRTVHNDASIQQRPLRVILNLILLALSTALPILLPVPVIPAPSGPYTVGTRIYEMTDTSRKELYSGKDEARRFQIQIWYPAEVTETDQRAPWMERADIYGPALSEFLNLPSFFMDHLELVKLPAYQEAKLAPTDEGFPIILFSHGWPGFSAQNTGQALELTSHGYVVIGIQHTYSALVTVFDDGLVAKYNPSALPRGVLDEEYDVAAHLLSDQRSGDMGYALDFLQAHNNDNSSPFFGSLDLSRIGVYGHSTGGGAAIQFCGSDERCDALLAMDPYMRPAAYEILERGISQPSFYLFSQEWEERRDSENNKLFAPFYSTSTETYGAIYIEGTAHYDFSDMPLFTPLAPQLGLKGPINGKRVTTIVNDYLLSFFDATLNGKSTSLFDNPSPYEEVRQKQ